MNQDILDLEYKTFKAVIKMEMEGIRIDTMLCHKTLEALQELNTNLLQKINSFSDDEINLKSSQQVSTLLFETLNLQPKIEKVGKNGCYSVDKSHLKKLSDQHDIIVLILDYRKTVSLMYFCKQLLKSHPITKRLHGQFNQLGTATGRFSSSKPNLQNIPNVKVKDFETNKLKVLESRFRIL